MSNATRIQPDRIFVWAVFPLMMWLFVATVVASLVTR